MLTTQSLLLILFRIVSKLFQIISNSLSYRLHANYAFIASYIVLNFCLCFQASAPGDRMSYSCVDEAAAKAAAIAWLTKCLGQGVSSSIHMCGHVDSILLL